MGARQTAVPGPSREAAAIIGRVSLLARLASGSRERSPGRKPSASSGEVTQGTDAKGGAGAGLWGTRTARPPPGGNVLRLHAPQLASVSRAGAAEICGLSGRRSGHRTQTDAARNLCAAAGRQGRPVSAARLPSGDHELSIAWKPRWWPHIFGPRHMVVPGPSWWEGST